MVAAIVLGLGGGLLMANIISPKSPKQELTRLERQMPPQQPVAATNTAPSQPVPYLVVAQPSAPDPANAAPAKQSDTAQAEQAQPKPQAQPQIEATDTSSTRARPTETSAAAQPDAAKTQPVARVQNAVSEEDATARTRDVDTKRVTERRRAERRQQWTERRRVPRQDREIRVIEDRVRDEPEPRQAFVEEPARIEMPRIRLFDAE